VTDGPDSIDSTPDIEAVSTSDFETEPEPLYLGAALMGRLQAQADKEGPLGKPVAVLIERMLDVYAQLKEQADEVKLPVAEFVARALAAYEVDRAKEDRLIQLPLS
jgi:hypothetical protein